jgi:hypothetical protein
VKFNTNTSEVIEAINMEKCMRGSIIIPPETRRSRHVEPRTKNKPNKRWLKKVDSRLPKLRELKMEGIEWNKHWMNYQEWNLKVVNRRKKPFE